MFAIYVLVNLLYYEMIYYFSGIFKYISMISNFETNISDICIYLKIIFFIKIVFN